MEHTTQKRTFFYCGGSHQIKKTCKNKCPPKKFLKSNNLFVILSFNSFSYLNIVSDSLSQIKSLPLDILDDFIHLSMTYLLHIAEEFQHILCAHNEQPKVKVSVQIISEKNKYFPTYTFHTSCEVRYLSNLLGEKWTHFLPISTFSPHMRTTATPSTLQTPQGK
jgi:hypothetical protein